MSPSADETLGAGLLRLKREFRELRSFAGNGHVPLRLEQGGLLELNLLSFLWRMTDVHGEPPPLRIPLIVVIEWIGSLITEYHTWGYLDHNRPYLGKSAPNPREVLEKLIGPLRILVRTQRWDVEEDELILQDWDVVVAHWEHVERARRSEENRRRISKALRDKVLEYDGAWCKYCGRQDNLTLDHRTPVTEGGRSELSNLRVLCRSCNSMRNNRRPYSWMMYQLMWYFGIDRDRLAEVLSLLSSPPSISLNRYGEVGLHRHVHGAEIEELHDVVRQWMCNMPKGELKTHRKGKKKWSEIHYDGPVGTRFRIVSEGCPDLDQVRWIRFHHRPRSLEIPPTVIA